ncbi:Hypothetical_protein [Hexamita inflata]|uniref:Hypothetical_protein n=1 Tax=Hexamita inflata TaxID=28002 RepID=A0AA86QCX0_9EUKA|nr:Hypothetical protein HINF_LOCUS41577 [Hexamita inflata]
MAILEFDQINMIQMWCNSIQFLLQVTCTNSAQQKQDSDTKQFQASSLIFLIFCQRSGSKIEKTELSSYHVIQQYIFFRTVENKKTQINPTVLQRLIKLEQFWFEVNFHKHHLKTNSRFDQFSTPYSDKVL